MDIQLTADTLDTITGRLSRFETVDFEALVPELDTMEKRNAAAFRIGMARQVPILQEHPLIGHFWYPVETAAAYHLLNSTDKVARLAASVAAVAAAVPIDEIHDVGANAGLFAAFCSRAAAPRLRCYEPIPSLRPFIAANAPQATIHEVALGDRAGETVSFFVNTQSLQTSSLDRGAIIEESATVSEITVPMERLDNIAEGSSIVKIDVQGAELRVLAGMTGCMRECQALLVESTYLSLDTITDIIPLLTDEGFRWLYIINDVSFGADILLTRAPVEECRRLAATSFELGDRPGFPNPNDGGVEASAGDP